MIWLACLAVLPLQADSFSASGNVFSGSVSIDAAGEILPVDDAFRLGAYQDNDHAVVFWQILPGYFLYRDKFVFLVDDKPFEVELPEGVLRQDEIFGEVQVFSGLVETRMPQGLDRITVQYQGCAAQGYCYPPQKRSLKSFK